MEKNQEKFYNQWKISFYQKTQRYLQILKTPEEEKINFWDVIVLTAIDNIQASYYQKEIEERIKAKSIPSRVKYFVFEDAKGSSKIGDGGATLNALQQLEKNFGADFLKFRILLLHAGGYSKRLLNQSVCGKIFASVPFQIDENIPIISMLELKLIIQIDFLRNMKPGVFLSCSDDLQFFEAEELDFSKDGVTALAHPSTAQFGVSHGVFVLPENFTTSPNPTQVLTTKCLKFLHKPTIEKMTVEGAILKGKDFEIFVDSNFFFDNNFAKKLLDYSKTIQWDCELNSYGDFLQPLGENPTQDYFSSERSTGSIVSKELFQRRKELWDLLQKSPIQVLPLIPSLFLHIGTMKEYLDHFTEIFPNHFGFLRWADSFFVEINKKKDEKIKEKICVQNSILHSNIEIEGNVVIENCYFEPFFKEEKKLLIRKNCILSQVYFSNFIEKIPSNILLHTIAININLNEIGYVTFLLGIEDDPKNEICENTKLLNFLLVDLLPYLYLNPIDIWNNYSLGMKGGIWNAKIFCIEKTPEKSAEETLKIALLLESIKEKKNLNFFHFDYWKNKTRISVDEALLKKNTQIQGFEMKKDLEKKKKFFSLFQLFWNEVDVLKWFNQDSYLKKKKKEIEEEIKNNKDNWIKSKCFAEFENFMNFCFSFFLSFFEKNSLQNIRFYFSIASLYSQISSFSNNNNYYCLEKSFELKSKAYNLLRDSLLLFFLNKSSKIPIFIQSVPNFEEKFPLSENKKIQIDLPARIILAGGWSDTPTFALEKGGKILNFSVTVEDKLPICARVKILEKEAFIVRLKSKDNGITEICLNLNKKEDWENLFEYTNPENSLVIHKACFCFIFFPHLCYNREESNQFVNEKIVFSDEKIKEMKEKFVFYFGNLNGIELETEVKLPKGSGLGTSSILILACLKAFVYLFSSNYSSLNLNFSKTWQDLEFNAVLCVEQLIQTCGGWQDQIGGGIKSMKYIETQASFFPSYQIKILSFSPNHIDLLNQKLLIVYTGKTRMAKVILKNIVENWATRKEESCKALFGIKEKGFEMFEWMQKFTEISIEKTEEIEFIFEKIGLILGQVKNLNIELEKSVSNLYLDSLFNEIEPFVSGLNIIGAGSGGFILGFLKKGKTKENVQTALKEKFPLAELTKMNFF